MSCSEGLQPNQAATLRRTATRSPRVERVTTLFHSPT